MAFVNNSVRFGDRDVTFLGEEGAQDRIIRLCGTHEAQDARADYNLAAALCPRPILTVCVPVRDWNAELSPWEAPPVFGREGFGSGADGTLSYLLDSLLPSLCAVDSCAPARYFLVGYSLAGLFALYAATKTDAFTAVAGVSPSVWFPGWTEYLTAHPVRCRAVYLSLGEAEPKAKNRALAGVGSAIRLTEEIITGCGTPAALVWNPGNHFFEPGAREARAIAWLTGQEY